MEILKNGKYTFEVVEFVPKGYQIWNIGKNMVDGYLPLCESNNEHEDDFSINTKTLKVIKIEDAQIVLSAIGGGQNTIELMERYVKRYKNAKIGTYSYRQRERILKALPIMKTIVWE